MNAPENRRFVRYEVRATVEIQAPGWRATLETDDLGAGGCRVTSDRTLPKGTPVTVRLSSSRSRAVAQGQATVAWASNASPHHLGLAFSDGVAEQVILLMQELLGDVPLRT